MTAIKMTAIYLIVICTALVIVSELAAAMTYRGWVNERIYSPLIEYQYKQGVVVNSFENDILTIGDLPFISKTPPLVFFSVYYISGTGMIYRFSKLHKRVKQIHEEALIKKYTNNE